MELFAFTEASFDDWRGSSLSESMATGRLMARGTRVAPRAVSPGPVVLETGAGKDTGVQRAAARTKDAASGINTGGSQVQGMSRGQGAGANAASRKGGTMGSNPPTPHALLLLDKGSVEGGRGLPKQVLSQVRSVFVEMLRRHHVVLSIFMAHGDAQLPISTTQRVTVGACSNTSMRPVTLGSRSHPPLSTHPWFLLPGIGLSSFHVHVRHSAVAGSTAQRNSGPDRGRHGCCGVHGAMPRSAAEAVQERQRAPAGPLSASYQASYQAQGGDGVECAWEAAFGGAWLCWCGLLHSSHPL